MPSLETLFHFAYYYLSEDWSPEQREKFLHNIKCICVGIKGLSIEDRDPKGLKISHYVLILDTTGAATKEEYYAIGHSLSMCLDYLATHGIVDHNPVKDWLLSEEVEKLYSW